MGVTMILNKKARSLSHVVTPLTSDIKKNIAERKNKRSFKPSQNKIIAKKIVKELCGKAPYELYAQDMLKKGNDKKAKRYLRKRMGTLKMAKKKMDELSS